MKDPQAARGKRMLRAIIMAFSVQGFRFSAISANIRKDGRIDVALAKSDAACVVAGVFTRNLVRAAPVVLCEERVRSGSAYAVLVNSGCANACTGEPGMEAARHSTAAVAEALGVDASQVLCASTGVIGALLPATRIADRARILVDGLVADGHEAFAQAICTTDKWPKIAHAQLETPQGVVSVLGIAKGAGMIHPDLAAPHATMLGFVFTDAQIDRAALEQALVSAVDVTLNACTVDGDTSTNDTVLAFASGASGVSLSAAQLTPALTQVCEALARSMVRDGEGSEHVVRIVVSGLSNRDQARQVAKTVATSPLVKTAIYGRDANWGRLLAAAGRAGVAFDPRDVHIFMDDVELVRQGTAVGGDSNDRATVVMGKAEYSIFLKLGAGPAEFAYLTSDLGHGYIDVNASYRS